MYKYSVYILECSDQSFYTGITNDMVRRLIEHQDGNYPKAYTYKRRPVELRFHIEFENVLEAIYFEKKLKGWTRGKKLALINGEYNRLQLLAECRNATHYKYNPNL
ncbi:GIY-YIG nuclease family protein [Christiangramia aquimixticola]|uniref:GIY-YIG nuclease family protein n=1 Tax=Christiangramia aquimixticola TaxID=1697558 RepID=UPI003AA8F01D